MTTLEELLKQEEVTAKAPIKKELVKPIEKEKTHQPLQLGGVKPTEPVTVEDEVAALLGSKFGNDEYVPELKETLTVADLEKFNTIAEKPSDTNSDDQLATLLAQPIVAVEEVAGELTAPLEFAHPAQVTKFDSSSVETLRASLDVLRDNINDKDIVGDAVYNLMINLQKDEKFRDQLSDEDLGLMVAGMRNAYGVTVQRKQSNKRKRTDASVQAAEVSSMLDGLKF